MSNLQTILECVSTQFGIATGEAIKAEISALVGMQNVDLTAINAAIAQINSLLDTDPETAGVQFNAASLIAQLTDLGTRITTLESSDVVQNLTVIINQIDASLSAEVARAQAAESALADQIDTINGTITSLTTQLAALEAAGGSGGCDCAAIATEISALQTAVTNLQATDAGTATQVAGIQTQLAILAGDIAAATAASASASASAAAALAAAAAVAADVVTINNTIAVLDDRETTRHNGHHGRLTGIEDKLNAIEAMDCTGLAALFAAGIAAGRAA
jgi:chromosome segregation ATPase